MTPFDLRPVSMIIGLALATLGTTMLVPAAVDLYYDNPDWVVFVASAMVTIFIGIALWSSARAPTLRFTLRQAFLLTSTTWLLLAFFSALPLYFAELGLTFPQAYFEAMSGLTTTGATVVSGLDDAPPGILIWRSMMQWIGGVGIIGIAVAVLPALQIGGMQLFRTESSEKSDKVLPRAGEIAGWILGIYVCLTLLCAIGYSLAGMGSFDAVAHAMTTVATGGFSTKDGSIGHFDSAAIEMVAIVFMIIGSLPFLLYFQALRGKSGLLFRDPQVRLFLALVGVFWLMTMVNVITLGIGEGWDAMRLTLFNVVALISTTGYAAVDYTYWGPLNDHLLPRRLHGLDLRRAEDAAAARRLGGAESTRQPHHLPVGRVRDALWRTAADRRRDGSRLQLFLHLFRRLLRFGDRVRSPGRWRCLGPVRLGRAFRQYRPRPWRGDRPGRQLLELRDAGALGRVVRHAARPARTVHDPGADASALLARLEQNSIWLNQLHSIRSNEFALCF